MCLRGEMRFLFGKSWFGDGQLTHVCLAVHTAQVLPPCLCRLHQPDLTPRTTPFLPVPPCSAVEAAVQKGRTALVMVESPTNPRMQVRRKGCKQPLRRSSY